MRGPAACAFLALGIALAGATTGCDVGAPAEARSKASSQAGSAPPPPAYGRELANLGAGIESGLALAAKRPDDGLLKLELASLYVERARLSGDYEDFRRAEAQLDALSGAKPTAAACLARARLHFTLHRIKRAAAALAACPPGADALEALGLGADIAMYSGRYRDAETMYRALVNQGGTPQQYVRLAFLRSKTGAPGEAAAFLEAAEKRYHGPSATMRAWLKLQRGLLAFERGRYDEALALYRLAEEALPGWWLVEEHIAEVTLLRGDARAAKALYAGIVERTQAPEFMDALAGLERAEGRTQAAEELSRKARAAYERRLADFPEAAAGHALDHFLSDPAEAPRALALAQANFDARPYGEAAIALARAWMLAGKPARAVPLVQAQLAAGWDTAEAHWVLAEALQAAGQAGRAEKARAEALRRNPQSPAMYASATQGAPK